MIPSIAPLRNVKILSELTQQMLSAPLGQERMACFYGLSGWGKTSAVCVAEVAFDAVAIEVPENCTKKYVMQRLCERLRISDKGSIPDMIQRVCAELVNAREIRPVIFDDAQYMMKSKEIIGLARDIYNGTSRLVPVILVGEEDLPRTLTQIENLHNRISVWAGAEPCEMADALLLAGIYAPGISIDQDLMAEIVEAAAGSIRRVNNNLLTAREIARSRGTRTVTRELWGNRSFFDGSVPPKRDLSSLRPKVRLASEKELRRVAK